MRLLLPAEDHLITARVGLERLVLQALLACAPSTAADISVSVVIHQLKRIDVQERFLNFTTPTSSLPAWHDYKARSTARHHTQLESLRQSSPKDCDFTTKCAACIALMKCLPQFVRG